jgi:putative alpha-1,2-mannosidase
VDERLRPVRRHAGHRRQALHQDARASWFSHKAELAKPDYYRVYLADSDVTAELTPTERAAQFRFTFPKTDQAWVVIDAFDKGSYVKVIPAERKIVGYSTRYARGPLPNFRNWFVIQFDKPFKSSEVWDGDKSWPGAQEAEAQHAGAIVGFATAAGEKVGMRVASSFISLEQAERNLAREIGSDDFDATRAKAAQRWNEVLGRVEVKGGSIDQQRTFYSSLYRMVQFPNKLYELDAPANRSTGARTTARCCRAGCLPAPASGTPSAPCILS